MANPYFTLKARFIDTNVRTCKVSDPKYYSEAKYDAENKEWFISTGVIVGRSLSSDDWVKMHGNTYDDTCPITATVESHNDGSDATWLEFHPSERANLDGDEYKGLLFAISLTPQNALILGRALMTCGQMYLDSMEKD